MAAAAAALAIAGTAVHWPGPIAHALDARIYIRWSPPVDDAARLDAERGLGLVAPRHVEGRTWEYTPTRTNREAVERIVKDQRVEDTHNVDRAAFVVGGAPQEDPFAEKLDQALEAAYDDQRIWVIGAATLVLFGFVLPMFEWFGQRLGASIRPVAIAPFKIFRVVFGLTLAGAIWSTPFAGYSPKPLGEQRLESWFADWGLFHWLAADSTRLAPLQTIATVAALVFAAGIAARAALAAVAGAVALLVLGRLGLDSAHDWGLALTTTLALVVVPWDRIARPGERSSDAMWRGFAIWLPGVMLGLGFLAAALAKLLVSGPSWITTGAVR
ncbi:MAG: hypothetical protein M3478_11480, partial [Planctomycetota bacterium]|nr:hypothetical protein [Planctomycetota bacterium]